MGLIDAADHRRADTGVCAWPSMVNVTVPVGVAGTSAETTAVKVTSWPTVDGSMDDVSVVVVGAKTGVFTVCVGSDPPLALKFVSPLYAAETECGPTVSVEVGTGLVHAPDDRERHGRLRLAVDGEGHRPRRRPRGPRRVTTAVKVTCWPTVDGFNEDVSVVMVACKAGRFTVCVGSDPLLGLTFASPLYAAETVCEPAVSVKS